MLAMAFSAALNSGWYLVCVTHQGGRHPPLDSTWSLDDLSAAATSIPASELYSPSILFSKWKVNQIP
jgi:hypothetical protein